MQVNQYLYLHLDEIFDIFFKHNNFKTINVGFQKTASSYIVFNYLFLYQLLCFYLVHSGEVNSKRPYAIKIVGDLQFTVGIPISSTNNTECVGLVYSRHLLLKCLCPARKVSGHAFVLSLSILSVSTIFLLHLRTVPICCFISSFVH